MLNFFDAIFLRNLANLPFAVGRLILSFVGAATCEPMSPRQTPRENNKISTNTDDSRPTIERMRVTP
ncbi:MAG: hypothetical protein KGQ57_01755, partial [Burkholderiales bacterium]|nr:hypothetical protein [Burkholderiales bacterium]